MLLHLEPHVIKKLDELCMRRTHAKNRHIFRSEVIADLVLRAEAAPA